jgi:hypothetical protein
MAKDYSQMTDAELQAEFAAQSGRGSQPTQILGPRPKPEGRPAPQTSAQEYADRIANSHLTFTRNILGAALSKNTKYLFRLSSQSWTQKVARMTLP